MLQGPLTKYPFGFLQSGHVSEKVLQRNLHFGHSSATIPLLCLITFPLDLHFGQLGTVFTLLISLSTPFPIDFHQRYHLDSPTCGHIQDRCLWRYFLGFLMGDCRLDRSCYFLQIYFSNTV